METRLSKQATKIATVIGFFVLFLVLMPNTYYIADLFGINLGDGIVRQIVDFVASGGTIVQAFAVILGVTLPAWVAVLVTTMGITSA